MPKLSVVVPAWNAGKYLRETLDCLLNQTLKNIEVVIVDDGSTDNTGEIAREYASRETPGVFFQTIFQPNAGVSAARNRGLEAASGEYILFLDSDDLLTQNSLEAFYRALEETGAGLAVGKLQSFGAATEKFNPYADELSNMKDIGTFDKRLLWNFLVGNKCYRRDRLLRSGVRFPALRYAEEGAFFMDYVYTGVKITGTPDAVMRYRRHSVQDGLSVSQSVSLPLAADFITSLDRVYRAAEKALEDAAAEELREEYLQEILYKTDHILLSQFYRALWQADSETIAFLEEKHKDLYGRMGGAARDKMTRDMADIGAPVFDKAALAAKPRLTVIAGGKAAEGWSETIESLYAQPMPSFELIVPASFAEKGLIPARRRGAENLRLEADKGFFRAAAKAAKAPAVLKLKQPRAVDPRLFRYILKSPVPEKLKNRFFGALFYLARAVVNIKGI
mgnify:CR=1 FL=1